MMMDGGGAFGGAKAGAIFDPVTFAKKPPVILRAVCLVIYYINYIIWFDKKLRKYYFISSSLP
jgi:hypothetical protein